MNLRDELNTIATEASAEAKRRAEIAEQDRTRKWHTDVTTAAAEFVAKRTKVLAEILRKQAQAGHFSYIVWTYEQDANAHGVQHEATLLGMAQVKTWLYEHGFDAELTDSGGEMVPDYGYVHTHTLTATWA